MQNTFWAMILFLWLFYKTVTKKEAIDIFFVRVEFCDLWKIAIAIIAAIVSLGGFFILIFLIAHKYHW